VASASCPDEVVAALAEALCATRSDPGCSSLLDTLCLLGFEKVAPSCYQAHALWAEDASRKGYPVLA
jgi:hypothetical protein